VFDSPILGIFTFELLKYSIKFQSCEEIYYLQLKINPPLHLQQTLKIVEIYIAAEIAFLNLEEIVVCKRYLLQGARILMPIANT